MLLEVLLIVTAFLFFIYKKTCTIPPGLPPGSFGWPVIGNLPLGQNMSQYLEQLRQKYGKIFTTKWGSHTVVAISDLDLLKKAFNHPDLQGRKMGHSFKIVTNQRMAGVVFSQCNHWLITRRWMIRMLKDLGMGKSALNASIQDEAAMLVKHLEQRNLDKPLTIDWCINVAVLNVTWQMVAGLRYDVEDEKILKFVRMTDENIAIMQGPMFLLDLFSWLVPFVPNIISERLFNVKQYKENLEIFRALAQDLIQDHVKKLDRANPRDMIDFYLLEIEKEMNNPDTIFKTDYANLVVLIHDMFVAGSETTANSLRWLLMYMAAYPKVQEKVHAKLDREVPRDRLPSLEDRPRLAYVEAAILDITRMTSFASVGMPHAATADVQLDEYTIPKGTVLFGTLERFHHDPALWEKPNELYPEHFLDSEGNLDSKKEGFVPFSVGRRQCPGESLARVELFLFTAAILQHFEITVPPGVKLDMEPVQSNFAFNMPKPFKLLLKKRYT